METLIIISVISSIIAMIAVVVFGVLSMKKKPEAPQLDLKEIGALANKIDNLKEANDTSIKLAVKDATIELANQGNANNKDTDEKLARFQEQITKSINGRFDSMNLQLESKISELNKKVDDKIAEGFKSTGETMTQVRERLQAIDVAQKNIEALSSDVVSLKTVLQGNQTRGQYGELQLSLLLHNVFGDTVGCYEEQYTFNKVVQGEKVRADAVVFMPEPNKLICIDSKFPFSQYSKLFETVDEVEKEELIKSFQNDVKKHITDIKNKYIIEDKTAPEAIMFIPNDGVFAFIHSNCEETVKYARESRVIITSPCTLPPILATINMVRIEVERSKNLKEISKQLQLLGKQFEMFGREWETFSNALEKISTGKDKLDKRVNRISSKFDAIKSNDPTDLLEGEVLEIEGE